MTVDKVKVRLDATNLMLRAQNPAVYGSVNIKDADAQAVKSGVWVEPITGTLMIEPLQFSIDAYKNTEIERNGKAMWHYLTTGLALDDHWDEVTREEERWLLNDGAVDVIESNRVFDKNAGFMFKFRPMGTSDDKYLALTLYVGQWRLLIYSDGEVRLRKYSDDAGTYRVVSSITTTDRRRLCDSITPLLIMPLPNGNLYVRQNGVAGFTYKLPPLEWQKSGDPVIEAGSVMVEPGDARIRFELTQLKWPYDGTHVTTYTFKTPTYKFIKPPVTGSSIHVEVTDDFPEDAAGGWSVYVTETDGETAFVPDDVKTDYKVRFEFFDSVSKRYATPCILSARVRIDPETPGDTIDPDDITADISKLTMHCGDRVTDTEAQFTIRNPVDHPIYGVMNRLCSIEVGANTLLYGVLKDPPRYKMGEDGHAEYECTMTTLAKRLQGESLTQAIQFDLMPHTTAVKWLMYFAGLVDAEMELDADTTPLPDTRKKDASAGRSELQPDWADKPLDWIDKICDESGFQFTDGYTGGAFLFKYLDPLSLPTTSVHTFCMDSDDCDSAESYQRLFSWDADSLEPESNELYVVSTDDKGVRVAARYWDKKSQQPTEPEGGYANWVGVRLICVALTKSWRPKEWLKRTCLRIGLEACKRRDFAVFHAEYPADKQLWKYDVVTIWDSTIGTKQPGIGTSGKTLYRILNISDIEFENEAIDVPRRRATYEAVRIGEVI